MEEKLIMCVGLCCIDVVNVVNHFPIEDRDERNVDQRWNRGGNAANNCTVLSMLGAPCEYLGTIAVSPELSFIKADFEQHNIKLDHVVYHPGYRTPLSTIIVNLENGSRTILHGCRMPRLPELTFEEFQKVKLSDNKYKWIHFEGRPSVREIKKMLEYIDKYNESVEENGNRIKTSVELEKSGRDLDLLLDCADVVFVGKDSVCDLKLKNKEQVVDHFISKCRKGATLICAWGEDGAIARTVDGKTVTSPIFPPNKVLDTLGAGDTFNAGTILALSRGACVEEAIQYGCRVAGAKCGIHGFDQLRQIFSNNS